jgi:hypothetical protein
MTVWVVTCADPAGDKGHCWAYGAYATREMARRTTERLKDATYWTVRLNACRVRGTARREGSREGSHPCRLND